MSSQNNFKHILMLKTQSVEKQVFSNICYQHYCVVLSRAFPHKFSGFILPILIGYVY